jgi:hypothetical protein
MCRGHRKHDRGLNSASFVNLHDSRETTFLRCVRDNHWLLMVINPPSDSLLRTQIRRNGHAGSIHDVQHRHLDLVERFVVQK